MADIHQVLWSLCHAPAVRTTFQEYIHQSASNVLHSMDPQRGTLCHWDTVSRTYLQFLNCLEMPMTDFLFIYFINNPNHNCAGQFARAVCNSNRSTSAGPLLWSLHWLPVRQRINFKLAKLCYLATSFQQPGYLGDLISPYSQPRLLGSSTQKLLSVPLHNLDTAARRFSVAAPKL